ncbi:hypothetical protein M758_6G087200 [Ceratodon purpureus]|nr:hypothetical protein M758_6G087200 [Ceratodon purpureus]
MPSPTPLLLLLHAHNSAVHRTGFNPRSLNSRLQHVLLLLLLLAAASITQNYPHLVSSVCNDVISLSCGCSMAISSTHSLTHSPLISSISVAASTADLVSPRRSTFSFPMTYNYSSICTVAKIYALK